MIVLQLHLIKCLLYENGKSHKIAKTITLKENKTKYASLGFIGIQNTNVFIRLAQTIMLNV